MIKRILSILRRDNVERATPEDYQAVFSSPEGQRVLADLAIRYRIGRPSFSFDKMGRLDIEASARSDAAKTIISDLIDRGKLRESEAEKPSRAKRDEKITRLPQAATNI